MAIDFESVSLREGLQSSSLNFSAPAFFSCLGVLVYLTREAAEAVFQLVAGFPAGSEIVFTFSTPEPSLVDEDAAHRAALAGLVNSLGEPWQTYFDPETLMADLRTLGFSDISFLSSDEADRRYFQSRSDGLRAPRRRGIGTAIVGNTNACNNPD